MNDNYSEKLLELKDIYGTPLYVYNFEKIEESIDNLKNAVPKYVNIFYSMKCNPNLTLLKLIKNHVNGIEVSSGGELFLAIQAGVEPNKIIFVGPGKTYEEIKYAIESDILSIVAESIDEIEIIDEISMILNKRTSISIRINPQKELVGARIKMGGISKQFGIDEEQIWYTVKKSAKLSNVVIQGIHVYMGTQILQEEFIINNVKNVFELAKNIQENFGIKLKLIDFGGGFGIPYYEGEKPLNMQILQQKLKEVFQENINKMNLHDIKYIFESGRYLIAESGTYLVKVLYKKESRGKVFIVTDGGSNHHSSAAGIGRFIRSNFPIKKLSKSNNQLTQIVDIVGTLCTPTDILAQNIELPIIESGDILAIENSGAYAFTASPLGFLSHPTPAEVMINKDINCIIRERGTYKDLLKGQMIIQNIDN